MEKIQWNSINKKQKLLKQSKNKKSSTLPWLFYSGSITYTNGIALRTSTNLLEYNIL